MIPGHAPTPDDSPSDARAWWTVALLVVLGMIAFLDRQVISLLVGPLKADLHISDTQVSLLQGLAFALLYGLFAIPIGQAVDRYSRRWVIFSGVFAWGLAATASGLSNSFAELLAARIFVGLGEAALAPAAYSIISDLFVRRRLALVLSIYSIGSSVGAGLALVITGILIGNIGDGLSLPIFGLLRPWQAVLFLTGLPGLLFCFLIFAIPEPRRTAPGSTTGDAADWAAVWRFLVSRIGFFACHFTGFACMTAIAYATMSWAPSVLNRGYGWPLSRIGFALGVVGVSTSIAGLLLNGALVDRMFARGRPDAHLRYFMVAAPAIALCGAAAAAATNAAAYLLLMVPVLMLSNFAGVSAAAIQLVTPPALRGRVSAIYLMVIALFGIVTGPFLVAWIGDHVVGPDHIQRALGIAYALFGAVACMSFALGRAPMRRALLA